MGLGVVIIVLVILSYMLFAYPIILDRLVVGLKIKRKNWEPKITIIVPAYNEEKFIKRKVENLLSCYPRTKMDIFVVDNGSSDKTAEIARRLPVRLLISKPGKINALNEGLRNAKTEVVVMTDADTLLDKGSLKNLISSLNDNVGAVGGMTKLKGKNLFYMESKIRYAIDDWKLRYQEGLLDSTISLDGKLIAFRKSLYKEFPRDAYQDDLEMTMTLRKKGYKCIIDDKAVVHEEAPSSFWEEIKQIRNRMRLTIMVNFKKMSMLFNPRYSLYSTFIFPSRRFFPLLLPFFAFYLWINILMYSWLIGILVIPIGIITLFLVNKEYLLMQLYGVGLAWLDVLTFRVKKGCSWEKVDS